MRFGIGQPVTRKEDPRFLTAAGAMSRTSIWLAKRTRSLSFRRTPKRESVPSIRPWQNKRLACMPF